MRSSHASDCMFVCAQLSYCCMQAQAAMQDACPECSCIDKAAQTWGRTQRMKAGCRGANARPVCQGCMLIQRHDLQARSSQAQPALHAREHIQTGIGPCRACTCRVCTRLGDGQALAYSHCHSHSLHAARCHQAAASERLQASQAWPLQHAACVAAPDRDEHKVWQHLAALQTVQAWHAA